jgi:hypothetical protein
MQTNLKVKRIVCYKQWKDFKDFQYVDTEMIEDWISDK